MISILSKQVLGLIKHTILIMRKVVVFLICSFFLNTSLKTYAQTDEGLVPDSIEYQALVDLYSSTDGGNWANNTNWLNGNSIDSIANWHGIKVTNGDVTEITLNNNNLNGTIPFSISNLTSLKKLYLNDNQLTGNIPSSIGGLTSLQYLVMRNNQLSGSIPPELGQLTNLYTLWLYQNQLTGSIPSELGQLSNLLDLRLSINNLIGEIPTELGNLNNLTSLYLQLNNLTGTFPSSIGQIPDLYWVNIDDNEISGIPDFVNEANLNFYVGGNNLEFSDLERFFDQSGNLVLASFDYSGQAKAGNEETVSFTESNNIEISVPVGGAQTNYQWQKKDGSDVWQDIAGATDSLLIIPNSALSDSGEYKCIMDNNWVTGLTIESNIITVNVAEKLLIGSWTFNDATANDESGNNNHGTVNGATLTTDRFGNENSAYSFDGVDDFIEVSNGELVDQNTISISAWIYRTADGISPIYIQNDNIGKATHYLYCDGSLLCYDNYNPSGGVLTVDGIPQNTWTYVTLVRDSDNVIFYVNGVNIGSGTGESRSSSADVDRTLIGARYFNDQVMWSFNGLIDDLNIYNYALSESEITELYNVEDPKQLIGSWSFNDGTANDESGNNNHGTINGATLTTDRFGNESSAYSFDGVDDIIEFGDVDEFEITKGSIATWFKFADSDTWSNIVAKINDQTGYKLGISAANELSFMLIKQGDPNSLGGVYSINMRSEPLNPGQWYHVVVTFPNKAGETVKVYINNTLTMSNNLYSDVAANSTAPFEIGHQSLTGYGQGNFNGIIDDVSIYNYILSETEIQELYNVPDPKQLIGSWTFNDGTANDHSGNDYHGTAINGATSTTDRFENEDFAYSFDGVDDYISLSGCENFATEKGTIAFWMKAQDHSRGIFKFYSTQADEHHNHDYIRSYLDPNGKIDLIVEDEDVAELWVQYDLDLMPNGYLNEWLHIAWTQDGNGVKLYVNGEEKPLEYITGNSAWWSGHLNITHALIGNCWGYFDGNIDDFQVYNYALSETEIQELYNATDPVIKLEVKVEGNTLSAEPEGGDENYTYQWSTGETTSSITTNEKGIYSVRVEDSKGLSSTATYDYNVTENHFDHNFVKTETARVSGVTKFTIKYLDEEEKSTTFNYFDGLGRQIQTVAKKASPIKNDIVQHIEYDEFGRQVKEYLPYSVSSENGVFREEAYLELKSYHLVYPDIANDVYPYAEKMFDDSPLNRVLEQGATGTAWQIEKDVNGKSTGNGYTIRMNYLTNSPGEVIKWSVDNSGNCTNDGFYTENTLFKNETKDENDHSVIEFVDLNGNTILKKTNDGTVDLFTYYIYDHFERLRYVLPPKAVDQVGTTLTPTSLSELIYYYEYDDEGRLVKKKIPGADEMVMVYDNRDRLVLMQDGNLEDNDKWSFTKYDMLNRPVMTGIVQLAGISYDQLVTAFKNHNIHFESINTSETHKYTLNNSYPPEAAISESDLLTVTYYDNYDCLNSYGYNYSLPSGFATVIRENEPVNQVTGTLIWNLDQSEYYVTVNYYDEYNRVIQTISENHLNGLDILTTQYDFVGNITQTKLSHTIDASLGYNEKIIREFYEYDHAGRLTHHYHQYGNSSADKVLMAAYEYNENGEHITKKMHSEDGGSNYLQEVNYKYNIRGWLTKINDADLSNSEDLFGMELVYNNPVSDIDPTIKINYNGNITGIYWNTNGTFKKKRGYGFKYDDINRLTDAYYGDNSGWTNGLYDVQGITYDLNGNIRSISRNAGTEHGEIDNLDYVYNGNKLLAVGDVAIGNANLGFNDGVSGSTGTEYLYDDNGNMIDDANKGLSFTYNELNLVSSVSKSMQFFDIYYDAIGNKLSTIYTASMGGGNTLKNIKYYMGALNYLNHLEINEMSGQVIFETFDLSYVLTPEGRITFGDAGEVNYEYFLKDHLGNNRVVFADYDDDGIAEIIQEDSYFPYGMQMAGLSERSGGIQPNQYLYNGKELHEELDLDWYDYGFRMYDPELGRWHVIDPLGEKYASISAYNYVYNNPINFIDPLGLEGDPPTYNIAPAYITADYITVRYDPGISLYINWTRYQGPNSQSFTFNWENYLNSYTPMLNNSLNFELANVRVNKPNQTNSSKGRSILDGVQLALDVAGLVPGVGEIFDGINAGIYALRGDYTNAALSAAAMVPFAGWAATGAKFVNKGRNALKFAKAADIAKTSNSYIKSNMKLGREMHSIYKATEANKDIGKIKEFVLPSGKRIDYIDFQNRVIYELKPYNPRAMRQGNKQLNRYYDEVVREFGGEWSTQLDVYY